MLTPLAKQSDILGAAMQASIVKSNVINHNIANQDTPGFKRKEVVFESLLADVLDKTPRGGVIDTEKIKAQIVTDKSDFSYRLDENNVDVENEMVALYKNMARYDVLVDSVMHSYKRMNMVFNNIK